MSKELEITTSASGDVSIINLDGDLTAVTGQGVEDAYNEAAASGSRKILFQFHEGIYVNSGGIAFLIGIAADSRDNGRAVRFSGVSEHFQKIFDMVGLTRYVEIFPTVEAALENF
jgi:anti-anti-sigma factor